MSLPNIRVDETRAQCTVSCSSCPSFVELAETRPKADAKAQRHLADVHPGAAGNTSFDRARQQRTAR